MMGGYGYWQGVRDRQGTHLSDRQARAIAEDHGVTLESLEAFLIRDMHGVIRVTLLAQALERMPVSV